VKYDIETDNDKYIEYDDIP